MRTKLAFAASIFAASFVTAASAQEIDWQKVDDAFGRKAAVSGRRSSLRLSPHRSDGDARRRHHQAGPGARRLGRVQAGAWRCDGDGRSRAAGDRDQSGHDQADRERPGDHRDPQSPAARQPRDVLHACRRPRRSREAGDGDPRRLGGKQDAADAAAPPATPPAIDLDTAQLDQIIGVKGQANGGVYQFGVPRRDPITEVACRSTPAGPMGVATAINFQPTGNGKAAITGDFVLTGDEVNPVIKALRANGIEVTAIHSHMLDRAAAADLHAFLGQ